MVNFEFAYTREWVEMERSTILVVSIGVNHTFKVNFTPLEYILTMAKRPHFFGLGFLLFLPTSSILVLYFLSKKRGRNKLTLPKPQHCWKEQLGANGQEMRHFQHTLKILRKHAKTWKKEILISVWSVQHPNADQNIQQREWNYKMHAQILPGVSMTVRRYFSLVLLKK